MFNLLLHGHVACPPVKEELNIKLDFACHEYEYMSRIEYLPRSLIWLHVSLLILSLSNALVKGSLFF